MPRLSHAPRRETWPNHASCVVGNGKQALSLTALVYRDRGLRTLLIPAFHCDSMALPYELEGFHVETVPIGDDLLYNVAALGSRLADHPRALVLHCETLGVRAGDELLGLFAQHRRRGGAVILDATHSVRTRPELLSGIMPPGPWECAIASMRKLLPTVDGAILAWQPELEADLAPLARVVDARPHSEEIVGLAQNLARAEQELAQLRLRSHPDSCQGRRWRQAVMDVCEASEAHEDAITLDLTPHRASPHTLSYLHGGARGADQHRAQSHAQALIASCTPLTSRQDLEWVGDPANGWAALRGQERVISQIRADLSALGAWGPLEWDPPAGHQDSWPYIVTLPTDQALWVADNEWSRALRRVIAASTTTP